MSFNNEDPGRSAKNHKPAIIAIVVAILVALLAWFVFMPGANEDNDGIATTTPPADTTTTAAEGTDAPDTPISPEGTAPVGEEGEAQPAN